jgi:hypothetical protein
MIKLKICNDAISFDGQASLHNYLKVLKTYSDTGKVLVMSFEEFSPDITEAQHKLFKALLIKGSDISGFTYKEFEDELIDSFAPYKYQKSIMGEMVKIRKQVSEMNHKEFNIFIEQCIQFCAEFYEIKF